MYNTRLCARKGTLGGVEGCLALHSTSSFFFLAERNVSLVPCSFTHTPFTEESESESESESERERDKTRCYIELNRNEEN